MGIKCGVMINARAANINTSARAYLFGATGHEAIACGAESKYLVDKASNAMNRPLIAIPLGGRYRIEGTLKAVKKLCQNKYDQRFARGNHNDPNLQIVMQVSQPAKKFSEHFSALAAGFGGIGDIPFVYDALTAGGAAGGAEVMLTFYLSYGGEAGNRPSAWQFVTKGDKKAGAHRDPVFALGTETNMAAVGRALMAYKP